MFIRICGQYVNMNEVQRIHHYWHENVTLEEGRRKTEKVNVVNVYFLGDDEHQPSIHLTGSAAEKFLTAVLNISMVHDAYTGDWTKEINV